MYTLFNNLEQFEGCRTVSLIAKIFPPVDIALKLEPEELAVPLLQVLWQCQDTKQSGLLNRYNFMLPSNLKDYTDPGNYDAIARAITEAWVWLERENFIAPQPGQDSGFVFVTRRGNKFRETADVQKFKAASLLPDDILDPKLAAKVRPPFLRGDYDSAIFEAFKEVEVRIRKLSEAQKDDIGVHLMRKAFHPESGPLTDKTQTKGEQQSICELFAGAIGSFKNPSSHRDVDFDNPVEVMELIMLADHLIRIAERRKS